MIVGILGFITGLVCVLLGIRENPWSWPVGISYNVFMFILTWHSHLYANSGLQLLYIVVAIYGWWNWLRGGKNHGRLTITRTPLGLIPVLAVAAAAGTFAVHEALVNFSNTPQPWADALSAILLVTAQYLLSRKMMGTWAVFIAGDLVSISMFIRAALMHGRPSLYWPAALYAVFIVLCVGGYMEWKKVLEQTAGEARG